MSLTPNPLRSAISVFVLLLSVNSCTEQKIASTSADSTSVLSPRETEAVAKASAFNKTVGSPIERGTALRWIANFVKANPNASTTEHFIQASVFKRMITNGMCVGVSLHYSLDDMNQLHIIPIAVDGAGKMIANLGFDIGDSTIDWPTQLKWIAKYTGQVRSHFFGALTFNRLVDDMQAQIVRISLARDDSGNPQLLLSDASSADPPSYEDKSSPCPPACAI